MGYAITKDNIHQEADEKPFDKVGKTYECICDFVGGQDSAYNNGEHAFKLLDDDGNLYFEGKSDDDSCFCPLDWSSPQWGCTEIQYYNPNTHRYETL